MTDRSTAYHEAGHAVIGRVLGLTCGEATIIATDGESIGRAHVENPLHGWERGDGAKRALAEAFCITLYAGAEAERLLAGSIDTGDEEDRYRATRCLATIGVKGASFVGDYTWKRYEERLRRRAMTLVAAHRTAIESLAERLISDRRVPSEVIDQIIG